MPQDGAGLIFANLSGGSPPLTGSACQLLCALDWYSSVALATAKGASSYARVTVVFLTALVGCGGIMGAAVLCEMVYTLTLRCGDYGNKFYLAHPDQTGVPRRALGAIFSRRQFYCSPYPTAGSARYAFPPSCGVVPGIEILKIH